MRVSLNERCVCLVSVEGLKKGSGFEHTANCTVPAVLYVNNKKRYKHWNCLGAQIKKNLVALSNVMFWVKT